MPYVIESAERVGNVVRIAVEVHIGSNVAKRERQDRTRILSEVW